MGLRGLLHCCLCSGMYIFAEGTSLLYLGSHGDDLAHSFSCQLPTLNVNVNAKL